MTCGVWRHCELRSSRSCAESQLLRLRSASHLCLLQVARCTCVCADDPRTQQNPESAAFTSAGGRGKRCHALNRRPPRRRDATPARRRPSVYRAHNRCEGRAVQFRAMTHAPVRMNTRVSSYMPATVPNIAKCTPARQRAVLLRCATCPPALPATDYVGVGYHRRSLHLRANEACFSSAMSRAHAIRAQAFSKDLCTKPNIQAYFTESWQYNVSRSTSNSSLPYRLPTSVPYHRRVVTRMFVR